MAKVYADLIKKGAICPKTGLPYTINDVPAKLQEAVQKILDEDTASKKSDDAESVTE